MIKPLENRIILYSFCINCNCNSRPFCFFILSVKRMIVCVCCLIRLGVVEIIKTKILIHDNSILFWFLETVTQLKNSIWTNTNIDCFVSMFWYLFGFLLISYCHDSHITKRQQERESNYNNIFKVECVSVYNEKSWLISFIWYHFTSCIKALSLRSKCDVFEFYRIL